MMPRDRELDYRADLFLRLVGAGAGSDARSAMSATSLASRSSRRRAMFYRTSMACRSASANARALSSAANRLRFERSMPSGDGSADFLAIIFNPH